MNGFYSMLCCLSLFAGIAFADDDLLVSHIDNLPFNESLSLSQTIDATFEHYPQGSVIEALQGEAQALHRRNDSLIAGYPMIYLQWIDDRAIQNRGEIQIQTGYQIPFWMWGQRDASRNWADKTEKSANLFAVAIKHEVAGLVRDSLWNLALTQNRHELAEQVYQIAQKLLNMVKRRVELGDLARSDQLMAESDLLEKQSLLAQAEAEVMHARKAYMNLTRLDKAPKTFTEKQSPLTEIAETHPALAASNAMVERFRAEVEWTKKYKQGNQPSILIGSQHDRAFKNETLNHETNLVLQIPIGGESFNAPFVAQANTALAQKIADRDVLVRQLEKALHEAEHILEVDKTTLNIANKRQDIAKVHLKMSQSAFEHGEINLIDFLKIQSNAQAAIREATERALFLQRDTAFYNQVIGVMP